MSDETVWKRCSTCKKPIGFRAPYFACSVTTCNRKGTGFAFCTVDCWDAHVPMLRHRDAWADEKTAPTAEEWAREQRDEPRPVAVAASPRRDDAPRPTPMPAAAAAPRREEAPVGTNDPAAVPMDVLVVVSKLKHYIRVTSGMNTSDEVVETLSNRLRYLCDDAVERARSDGRKTVMARDFRRPTTN